MNSGVIMPEILRLGVNIDHVATIRNARGGHHPDPLRAAHLAAKAGADGITAHLREDRRHMTDTDIESLIAEINLPLNLEMAATDEMLKIALKHRPHAACIVPEKRQERTTEGGLDAIGTQNNLMPIIRSLTERGIRVSLFIEADIEQIDAAKNLGAPVVEIHTGAYCDALGILRQQELSRIKKAASYAADLNIEVHAGHGLGFDTVGEVAEIPQFTELNIGHFLIGEAIFGGLDSSIRRMRSLMDNARATVTGERSA
jgi:pyridoxine 5-phosphate synthase